MFPKVLEDDVEDISVVEQFSDEIIVEFRFVLYPVVIEDLEEICVDLSLSFQEILGILPQLKSHSLIGEELA